MKNALIGIGAIVFFLVTAYFFWPELSNKPQQSYSGETLYTYSDQASRIEFKYPMLPTAYVHAQEWPPTIKIATARTCDNMVINGRAYCVRSESAPAAGTLFTTYTYSTIKDRLPITFTFTLGYPQCANFDEPNKTACQKVQRALNIDAIVDLMVTTLKFH